MTHWNKFVYLPVFVLITGIAGVSVADDAPERVTYAKDIAPIFNDRCVNCHRPGQIGPMTLRSYDEVRPWAKSIKKSVAEKSMPPWFAESGHQTYKNDHRLTDDQIAMVTQWVDRGAPAGDLSKAPAQPQFEDEGWQIGQPDAVYTMPEPFKVEDDVEDQYMHFRIETGLEKDSYIKSMELKAGANTVVHHILVFIVPSDMEGTDLFDGGAVLRSTFLTGWAPGTPAVEYQENFGKLIPANATLLFQLHYHKEPGPGTGAIDQSSMAVKFWDEKPNFATTTAWIWDPTLHIPPHESNYVSTSSFDFKDDGYILGMVPHMHLRGKSFEFVAIHPDNSEEVLLRVPNFDFNWQLSYSFPEPKYVEAGTTVRARAVYDNSADNPNNPDPDQTLFFQESTEDEMMIGFMEYAYEKKPHLQQKFGMPESMKGGGLFGGGTSRIRERLEELKEDPDRKIN